VILRAGGEGAGLRDVGRNCAGGARDEQRTAAPRPERRSSEKSGIPRVLTASCASVIVGPGGREIGEVTRRSCGEGEWGGRSVSDQGQRRGGR